MDILGKWKCALAQVRDDNDELVWIEREKFIDLMGENDAFSIFNATLDFCEDGLMRTLFPVPEGTSQQELDDAAAKGLIYDGMLAPNDPVAWKTENGKAFVAFGEDGDWTELVMSGDTLEFAVFRFVRA